MYILRDLSRSKFDGQNYDISDYFRRRGLDISHSEAFSLGQRLDDDGYIKFAGSKDSAQGRIMSEGVDYLESVYGDIDDMHTVSNQAMSYTIFIKDKGMDGFRYDSRLLKQDIEKQLMNYNNRIHHLLFLDEVLIKIEALNQEHSKECTDPQSCEETRFYKEVLFFIKEMKIMSSEDEEPVTTKSYDYRVKDPFSEEDLKLLHDKLDEILLTIKTGQGIIYDDMDEKFEEIKELAIILGKNKWKTYFQGFLLEVFGEQILEKGGEIYQIVEGFLQLPPTTQ